MSIVFNVKPGSVMTGSHKSILFDTSIKAVDGGHVVATDGSGRVLPLTTSNQNGWFKVSFTFAEPVNGTETPTYVVNLAYTVLNGICKSTSGFEHFSLPWAHRWVAQVKDSKYQIEFSNSDMNLLMGAACFGASGFPIRCGQPGMVVNQTRASYATTGSPYNVFFEWAGVHAAPDRRFCNEADGQPQSTTGQSGDNQIPVQAPAREAAANLTIGIAALGSSCLFASIVITCACKLPVKTKGGKSRSYAKPKAEDTGTGHACGQTDLEANVACLAREPAAAIGCSERDWEVMDEFHVEDSGPMTDFHESAKVQRTLRMGCGLDSFAEPPEFPADVRPVPPHAEPLEAHRISSEASNGSSNAAIDGTDWEVTSEFRTPDKLERGVICEAPFSAIGMSSVAQTLPLNTGESTFNSYPGTWNVMQEFTSSEPLAECRSSMRMYL
jgi:hypothetical protein